MTAKSETALIAARQDGALARTRKTWAVLPPYAALEARRNRLLYAGWPVVILGSLPASAAIAVTAGYPAGSGTGAALFAWALAGLPFTALLFGAVAGAGLRGRAEEDEAALPLSPRTRAFAALAAAAGGLAASAALVTAAIALASPEAQNMLILAVRIDRNWYWNPWFNRNTLGLVAVAGPLALSWLLTTAFGVGQVSGHAVLGGVAALFAGTLALTPVIAGLALEQVYPDQAGFTAPALGCLVFLVGGALVSLAQAAALTGRARRPSWSKAALLAGLPLAGALTAWTALYGAHERVLAASERTFAPHDFMRPAPAGRFKVRLGPGGGAASITPEGDIVLLEGSRPSLGEMLRKGTDSRAVSNIFRDRRGFVWAEVTPSGLAGARAPGEIHVGRDGEKLRRYMTMPPYASLTNRDGWATLSLYPHETDPLDLVPLDPAKPPFLKGRR